MKECERLISELFKRLDARDFDGFLALFSADAEIVHPDDALTSPAAFVAELKAEGMREPASRSLDDFAGGRSEVLAWASYRNRPVFGGETWTFHETAVFVREGRAWRVRRLHYTGGKPQ